MGLGGQGYEGAALAAAALGYGVYEGERQAQIQRRGIRLQEQEQRRVQDAALRTQRENEQAIAAATQRMPEVDSILESARLAARMRRGATSLTGVSGVDPAALQLQRHTLLGS